MKDDMWYFWFTLFVLYANHGFLTPAYPTTAASSSIWSSTSSISASVASRPSELINLLSLSSAVGDEAVSISRIENNIVNRLTSRLHQEVLLDFAVRQDRVLANDGTLANNALG